MFKGGSLVPFIVDDYFAAASLHQDADLAWQLATVDFNSFGVAGLMSLVAEHEVSLRASGLQSCNANNQVLDAQGARPADMRDRQRLRTSTADATATATSAGLVCVHHKHLPLFGGGAADLAPCLIMIGVSAATGVLRLVYDEHWASDVIVGWADGVLSGYVIPSLMHFDFGSGRPVGSWPARRRIFGVAHCRTDPPHCARGIRLGMLGVF